MQKQCFIGVATLAAIVSAAHANPQFFDTSSPLGNWFVSTTVSTTEGVAANFGVNPFTQAVNLTSPGRPDWIADVPSGSRGLGNWTYFVFRQTFDLTGYDPSTANLTIRWAADDGGQGGLGGSWIPAFRVNGGSFVNYIGSTRENPILPYSLSAPQSITSGFVPGLNTIDFYVQGNGQTDGFLLEVVSFTAVPTPGAAALLGLGGLLAARRRR
jgi:MYXO-CTERM domain-containing protein